jgi:hypothetical protein
MSVVRAIRVDGFSEGTDATMAAGLEPERQLQAQVVNLGLVSVSVAGAVTLRCECGERRCRARILVTRAEYDRLTRGFQRLFVSPGHGADAGRVVNVNDRFALVDLDVPRPLLVEVLSIEGCPYADTTEQLVEAIAQKLDLAVAVRRTVVDSPRAAVRLHFLGSPTVRVNGVDVEPGAAVRCDYALGCRLYRTAYGSAIRMPAAEWIGAAFAAAASGWPTGSGGGVRGEGAAAAAQ